MSLKFRSISFCKAWYASSRYITLFTCLFASISRLTAVYSVISSISSGSVSFPCWNRFEYCFFVYTIAVCTFHLWFLPVFAFLYQLMPIQLFLCRLILLFRRCTFRNLAMRLLFRIFLPMFLLLFLYSNWVFYWFLFSSIIIPMCNRVSSMLFMQ